MAFCLGLNSGICSEFDRAYEFYGYSYQWNDYAVSNQIARERMCFRQANQQYEIIKGLLLTKYGSTFSNYGTQSDKEAFGVLVASKSLREDRDSSYSLASNGFKGAVDLYIAKDDSYLRYPYWFNLHIDYMDAINSEKHQNQSLEDI